MVAVGGAPRQFAYEFVHHGVVLDALHRQSYTAHRRGETAAASLVELVYDVLQLAEQAHITAVVEQHAERPVVPVEAILAIPCRLGVAPLRTALREEVEHEHITVAQMAYHLGMRTRLPSLHHPHRRRVHAFHLAHYRFARRAQVYALNASAFVEGVHAVEACLAVEALLLLIV